MRIRILLASIAALAALAAGASTATAESTFFVQGYDEPSTPARYDRVRVKAFGPTTARRVLVLVPGTIAGAGSFTPVARQLVARVRGLQIWAIDRRSNALEDTSRFQAGHTPEEALDYYGGLKFRQVDGAREARFARRWGLKVSLEDVRRVVLRARQGGRKVTLGGHSLGASTAVAYATWDFAGRPGYRDVDGLVLIDGGLLGTFNGTSLVNARRTLASINQGDPFAAALPGLPVWAAGVLSEVAAMFARRQPQAPSALQSYPLLPAAYRPPVPVTNEALLGYAFDRDTAPRDNQAFWVRGGNLAGSGDPRRWVEGGRTPAQNIATALFQEPVNGIEWYFPRRLTLDVDAASPLSRTNRAALLLGLRTWHLRTMNLPIYAYQTAFTNGRVLRGAKTLFRRSNSPRASYVNDPGAMHNDPVWGKGSNNFFLRTVTPFLQRLG
jgi:pimeloyl-ACP methyl ester carboxylesterase